MATSDERRKCRRKSGEWVGRATLESGPRVAVSVRDLSATGARLIAPETSEIHLAKAVALTTYRRGWWRFSRLKPVRAVGRIIRATEPEDGLVEVAIRFHSPLPGGRPTPRAG